MKYLLVFILLSVIVINCGSDGVDGDAYLSFEWDWYVDGYGDDNPGIPSSISENVNYKVNPGTYEFAYVCSDGEGNSWYFDGTYKIKIEEGTEGGFLTDGDDGDDKYYTLDLDGIYGASLYKTTATTKQKRWNLTKSIIDPEKYQKYGEPMIETSNHGKYLFIVEKQMYVIKK